MTETAKPEDRSANDAAVSALVPDGERADLDLRVRALLARNAALQLIESTREEEHLTKKALAERAGLEESSVRRLLTSDAANPTSENFFLLMGALGIHVEAVTPSGRRVPLV
jgi:hypothetical protein